MTLLKLLLVCKRDRRNNGITPSDPEGLSNMH